MLGNEKTYSKVKGSGFSTPGSAPSLLSPSAITHSQSWLRSVFEEMPLAFLLRHLLVGHLHLEPLNVLFFSQSGYTELSGGSVFTNSALLAVTELF